MRREDGWMPTRDWNHIGCEYPDCVHLCEWIFDLNEGELHLCHEHAKRQNDRLNSRRRPWQRLCTTPATPR